MKKGILLTILALMCQLAVVAQNYDRYNYFHEEAMKLKNEGKLNEAKEKFKKIKVNCQGGIPQNNDLDKMIKECTTIILSEDSLQFGAYDDKPKNVTVKVNAKSFTVNSNTLWCKVSKKGSVVSVSCENNDSPYSRNAGISIAADGKTVSMDVLQNGGLLKFEVQPDSIRFSKLSETIEVSIVTNAETWQVDSVPDWIEYETNDSVLLLTSMQNNLALAREATVFVVAFDEKYPIAVSQAQADTMLSVDKEELVFPCKGSKDCFKVESNIGPLQVRSSDDWISYSIEMDTVRVRVEANESFFGRHGWIEIGSGTRFCTVLIHQYAFASIPPTMKSEINIDEELSKGSVMVKSVPSDLKVTVIDDGGESSVKYTPFEIPIDYGHYSLQMGFENREVFANERQQDVLYEPGMRFATITWSPKTALGMMSGFVGAKSWGAYTHFQAYLPFVTNFLDENRDLAAYGITFGPVFRPNAFPYVGAYAGVGVSGFTKKPHIGFDYEAGVMGFYKNFTLSMGFHTTRLMSLSKHNSFTIGVGGYLKRYYDNKLGYCASDSRRWTSLNYVFRPSENGKGLMVSDIGKDKVRVYFKALYLSGAHSSDSSLMVRNVEAGLGIVFTPVNSIIDMCLGASGAANITGLDKRFQGIGVELGTILNIWRFPISVFLHESDLFGERHLCVDFGVGFHLGEFEKSKSSYQ